MNTASTMIQTVSVAAFDQVIMHAALADISSMMTLPLATDAEVKSAIDDLMRITSDALSRTDSTPSARRAILQDVAAKIGTLSEVEDEAAYGIWDIARDVLRQTAALPALVDAAPAAMDCHRDAVAA